MRRWLRRLRIWILQRRLGISITLLLLSMMFVYLIPDIFISVLPGHAAVKWQRFGFFGLGRGTVVDHIYGEGLQAKWPWDLFYLYDIRLQELSPSYDILTSDGLRVELEVTVRYRPIASDLATLHKTVGPRYREVLLVPEIGAQVRHEIGQFRPDELYSDSREKIERAIFDRLTRQFYFRHEPRREYLYSQQALDAPVRWRVLDLLRQGPLSADDVATRLGIDPSAAPRFLAELEDEGIVEQDGDQFVMVATGARDPSTAGFLHLEDFLIRSIKLPASVSESIEDKLVQRHRMLEYEFRLTREFLEARRKAIEADGIRAFQDRVSEGISERYLKWKGIDATLELARSENSKIVVIGAGEDGLPIILGGLESPGNPAENRAPAPETPDTETPDSQSP
ncbi:MAG: SPFH domain-containing protein [Thermoanaerobaculia bacterium]|nr:SPFH domain-containing protein [Thermoanaerobaculia bacterium]